MVRIGSLPGCVGLLLSICVGGAPGSWGNEEYLSPALVAASPDGTTIYVGEATGQSVAIFDVKEGTVRKRIALEATPNGLAVTPKGDRLVVTVGEARGKVLVLDADGTPLTSFPAGHTPMAPVLQGRGNRLYLCNRFDNAVVSYNLSNGKARKPIAVPREPIAAVLSKDGTRLLVANHLPAGAANGAYAAAAITIIDTKTNAVCGTLTLPNGSTSLRGLALSADGKHAYATHILGRYQLPTTQLERGWMNTNALTVVDVAAERLVNTILLDDVDLGAANPWGVAASADGKWLCVAHAGTHEVSVIDQPALLAKLEQVAGGTAVSPVSRKPEDVPNDLSFLYDLRKRIKLSGFGPRGAVIVGDALYAAEYFTDSLGKLDLKARKALSIPLGPEQPLTQVRQGEMHFADGAFCFQSWQSCTSCHPDSRADALNWDLLNDGLGNPKQTKSMLLSHMTPPAMITGIRADAETAVRSGMIHIQFAVRPEEDAQAIDAYLKSLKPVESPYLVDGKLSDAANRGHRYFDQAGCAECHSGPYYTDQKLHDVGTGRGMETGIAFDTPTLIEVWRTAPYLHNGSAATMEAMLTTENPEDKHGKTADLTEAQIKDLAEYVNSL